MKNNYKFFKSIRKPIAPPTKVFNSKKEFEDQYLIDQGINDYLYQESQRKTTENMLEK